jgi:hypothetical protein
MVAYCQEWDRFMANGFLDRLNVSTVAINGLGGLCIGLMALYAPLEKFNLPQPYTSYILWAIAAVFVFIVCVRRSSQFRYARFFAIRTHSSCVGSCQST